MSGYNVLTYQRKNDLGFITLNRPQSRNSLNRELRQELISAIEKANNDERIRVVVISGAGKSFCSGADLTEKLAGRDADNFTAEIMHNEYHPIIKGIFNAPKPYISAVNGAAAGIGSSLAMACDLMVMADDAFLYSPFAMISLIPDGGCHKFLLSLLGSKRAYEVIAFSERISAEECLSLGVTNKVVEKEKLLDYSIDWANKLAEQAPLSLKFSKQLLRESAAISYEEVMNIEAKYQNIVKKSSDHQVGVQAFFEKRKANFIGK
ncbi:enoyl-CoA hydratase/isomerase family protein [Colwellia sp. E150_009]|jgi:2-(1,2-epoxy-1,2-dihydrophenyl)acetyl-CoA isomerase